MDATEIKAELSIKLVELDLAKDLGKPYPELKKIYDEIKQLQYRYAMANHQQVAREDTDLVIE